MLIQIARAVTLGIFDTEVQTLKIGEIYRVAPGIGTVLVSDGWAREVETDPPSSSRSFVISSAVLVVELAP